MSAAERPTERGSVIDLTGDGPILQPQGTEERVRHSFAHLLDAFAALTAVRDGTDQIIDFRVDYANDGARAAGAAPQNEVGTDPRESLAERHKRELFDDFCRVVETGEPLATQSFEYEDAEADTGRIARSFEVRAERIGDGLAVVWRDVTAHVLVKTELEQRNQELALVGEMVEYLQAVESSDEVFEIAASFCSRLFGALSGGLFLRNESGHVLEAVTSWGDLALGDQVFPPESCWAMRRGKRHGSLAANDSPRCAHAADDVATLLCIPLITQGQETGLLVLVASGTSDVSNVSPSRVASEALAVSVCEHLGLALTNIRLRESLREQSIRDPLTDLFNLRYLEETLEREISRSTRSGKPVGLMMLDVDHFKAFNDTFGHPGGDALLCELSNLLQSVTRVEDAACRYGGDEFVVLLPESSLDITLERAEEIRKAAARFNITHEGAALDPVTLTVGVAVYPDHATDMTGLLRAADEAMYEAKHAGGDRVLVAQTASDEDAVATSS
jgi:diguanylate cyclase (GGDEF)-like protein